MKDDSLNEVLARGRIAKKYWGAALDVKDVSEMIWNESKICGKYYILIEPGRGNALWWSASANMSKDFTRTYYDEVRKAVMGCRDSANVWNENSGGNAK